MYVKEGLQTRLGWLTTIKLIAIEGKGYFNLIGYGTFNVILVSSKLICFPVMSYLRLLISFDHCLIYID